MQQIWEDQAASRGQPPIQKLPHNPTPSQLKVLTNPFAKQGFVAAQPHPVQAAHPPNLLVLVTTKSS